MAIAVIALTTAMITPPLFLAAATRMQNQRAEQAMQIAQGEVDRVRFLVERQQHDPARLPALETGTTANLDAIPAPTNFTSEVQATVQQAGQTCSYNGQQVPTTYALLVDTTGDCQADFAVQTVRLNETIPAGERSETTGDGKRNRPSSFCMVVRVYGKPAIENVQNSGTLTTTPASLQFTTGEGDQSKQPLAVLTTPITWSDRGFSADTFRDPANVNGRICPYQN